MSDKKKLQDKKNQEVHSKQKRRVLGRGLKSLLEPSFVDSPIKEVQFLENEESRGFNRLEKKPLEKGPLEKGIEEDLAVEDLAVKDKSFRSAYKKGNRDQEGGGEKEKSLSRDSLRVKMVGIEQLVPNENQPRRVFDDESLQELALSIKEKGILQPILVRSVESSFFGGVKKRSFDTKDKIFESSFSKGGEEGEHKGSGIVNERFEIIAGERRWRAAQKVGLHEVPVILKEASDQKSLELALVENIQRKNLNPLEEARAYYHLLKEYSLTQAELARYLGKDKATLRNLIRLLNLSDESKKALSSDKISLGIAKVILGLKYEEDQNTLLEYIIRKNLTVREVTEQVHWFLRKGVFKFKESRKKVEKTKGETDLFLNQLIENLQQTLGTRVRLHHNRGKGKVIVYFYSDEELNRITDHILKSHE